MFVMLSGALLNRRLIDNPWQFIAARLKRFALLILIWSAIYFAWRAAFHHEPLSAPAIARDLFHGQPYYHLYFLFSISDLSIVAPVLSPAIQRLPRRLSVALSMTATAIAGITIAAQGYDPNFLTYFVHYIGYFALGALLPARSGRPRWHLVVVIIAAISLTAILTAFTVSYSGGTQGRWSLYFYNYFSPTVVVAAIAVFILFARLNVPLWSRTFLQTTASLTLGVYLIHPIILELLRWFWTRYLPSALNPAIDVPLTFALTALLSGTIVFFARRVPALRAAI